MKHEELFSHIAGRPLRFISFHVNQLGHILFHLTHQRTLIILASEATVSLPTPFHPKAEEYASRQFKRVLRPTKDLLEDECLQLCDGMVLRIGNASAEKLALAKRLQIITRNGTGCDMIDLDTCRQRGIIVTNLAGLNAKSVAELTLTLILAITRRVKELDVRIRSGEIVPSIRALSPGLFHSTVGLVGMGSTAYETARLLRPFGCRILVYSPSSPLIRWSSADTSFSEVIPHERFDNLGEMLRQVDVLSIHCPLTPKTRGMIREKELGVMKPSAVIINTARGGIIDESALTSALKEGRSAGAGLDVFEREPAHGETMGKLGKMDNVICLLHIGASTHAVQEESCVQAIDIMVDFFEGRPIKNRVV